MCNQCFNQEDFLFHPYFFLLLKIHEKYSNAGLFQFKCSLTEQTLQVCCLRCKCWTGKQALRMPLPALRSRNHSRHRNSFNPHDNPEKYYFYFIDMDSGTRGSQIMHPLCQWDGSKTGVHTSRTHVHRLPRAAADTRHVYSADQGISNLEASTVPWRHGRNGCGFCFYYYKNS